MRREVFQLSFFGGEEEAVVVETYFAEGYAVTGCGGGESKVFEGGEEGVWATRMGVEVLCGAGVDSDCGVADGGVLLCDGNRVLGFDQIGACYHELLTADGKGAVDDSVEIIFVCFFAVIDAAKDGVGEVDADLVEMLEGEKDQGPENTRLRT